VAVDPLTLGLSGAALVVSIVTFYIGHRRTKKSEERAKKSEEICISRETWDRIKPQEDIIENWTRIENPNDSQNMKMISAMNSLTNELGYFVYLILLLRRHNFVTFSNILL